MRLPCHVTKPMLKFFNVALGALERGRGSVYPIFWPFNRDNDHKDS